MNTSGKKIKDLVKIKNNIHMSVRKTHEIKLNDIITWHFYTVQKLSDLSLTFWKKIFCLIENILVDESFLNILF